MNSITMKLNADHLIQQALAEDITSEDITTNAVMPDACPGEVELICKQDGIICDLMYLCVCSASLMKNTEFDMKAKDWRQSYKRPAYGNHKRRHKSPLSGERTALNYLQRMSELQHTQEVSPTCFPAPKPALSIQERQPKQQNL